MELRNKIILFTLCSIGYIIYLTAQVNNQGDMEAKEQIMKKHQAINDREPAIGIEKTDRQVSITILNKILANEFILLVQTLNYHWNLIGPQFNDYHKLFDDQYNKLFGFLDVIAERVRAVGGIAVGSMAEAIRTSNLQEDTGDVPQPTTMVENLLQQHEKLIQEIRKGIDETAKNNRDMGTSNFLTDLIEKHEKMAWMLRSLTVR